MSAASLRDHRRVVLFHLVLAPELRPHDIAKVVERLGEYAPSGWPKIPAHVWVGKAKTAGFRYQFRTMNMVLQDAEGKGLATLSR